VLNYPEINNQREVGPQACPQPQIGAGTIFCKNGTTEVLDITVVMLPVVAGQSSDAYINETTEDTFLLCECCTLPAPAPPPAVVQGLNRIAIIYWALGTAAAGGLIALSAGLWLMRKRTPTKPSRVLPEVENEDKLDLEDDEDEDAEEAEASWQLSGSPALATPALKDAQNNIGQLALANVAAVPREPLALALHDGPRSSLALVQVTLPLQVPANLKPQLQSTGASPPKKSPSNLQLSNSVPLTKKDQVKAMIQSTRATGNNLEWKNW